MATSCVVVFAVVAVVAVAVVSWIIVVSTGDVVVAVVVDGSRWVCCERVSVGEWMGG